jgi:hypothetical protein
VPQKPLIACVDEDVPAGEALEGLLKASGFTADVFSSAEGFLQSARLDESCTGSRIPVIVITEFPDRPNSAAGPAGPSGLLLR